MDRATVSEMQRPKELISEAAQTVFRESESQYLNWDITKAPPRHPSEFPRGRGLHYPILYNPAWPVHVAASKKDVELPVSKKKTVVGSYALTGVTLSERERKPIKKTLLFPHRNTDLPFRQSRPRNVKELAYERCESLTLQAIEEIEPRVMYKSILERLPKYNVNDKNARALAIRKVLLLGPVYVEVQGPPTPRQRSKRQRSQKKANSAEGPLENEGCEPLEIIFVDEGPRCNIHGATMDAPNVKNCEIHGNSGIIQDDEKKGLIEE